MATFTWTGQSTTSPTGDKTIGSTDKLSLYGANFNDAVVVNSYQDSTHVENSANAEQCAGGPHMNNTKYVDATHVSINGGASAVLASNVPTNAQCPLKVNFSHGSAVATSAATFWADDGSVTTNPPTDLTVKAGEKSNTSWSSPGGSGAAMALADQASATSHDFYIFLSCTPTAVGVKTAARAQIQLTYQ